MKENHRDIKSKVNQTFRLLTSTGDAASAKKHLRPVLHPANREDNIFSNLLELAHALDLFKN